MKLVFATNNINKLSEIRALVSDNIQILSLKDINCSEELPETYPTLQQNALQKARYVFDNYGFNCFSDDTGLEIDALAGEPGVYSARYAGEDSNSAANIQKVLKNLQECEDRGASFRTVIALVIAGKETFFEGECKGDITKTQRGLSGFGYDPIFIPDSFNKTFSQMTKQEKGFISHRGKAVKKLLAFLSID